MVVDGEEEKGGGKLLYIDGRASGGGGGGGGGGAFYGHKIGPRNQTVVQDLGLRTDLMVYTRAPRVAMMTGS